MRKSASHMDVVAVADAPAADSNAGTPDANGSDHLLPGHHHGTRPAAAAGVASSLLPHHLAPPLKKTKLSTVCNLLPGKKAVQEHENEVAEVVIVCEPEQASLMMGGLHPRASLYERPVNTDSAKSMHAEFRKVLRESGVKVRWCRKRERAQGGGEEVAAVREGGRQGHVVVHVAVQDEASCRNGGGHRRRWTAGDQPGRHWGRGSV